LEQALDTFTQATHGALKKAGKTAVVWEGRILPHNRFTDIFKFFAQKWFWIIK